jgi:hypothetical protein
VAWYAQNFKARLAHSTTTSGASPLSTDVLYSSVGFKSEKAASALLGRSDWQAGHGPLVPDSWPRISNLSAHCKQNICLVLISASSGAAPRPPRMQHPLKETRVHLTHPQVVTRALSARRCLHLRALHFSVNMSSIKSIGVSRNQGRPSGASHPRRVAGGFTWSLSKGP